MDCRNYGRYGSRPEQCPECEYAQYCKDARDLSPISSCEYDDARSNSITESEAKDNLPSEQQYYLSPADMKQALYSVMSIAKESETQFNIILCWISEFGGTNGKGRDGLIKGISKSTGYSARTVQRHVQNIADDPVLGKMFVYHNMRTNGRQPDKGNGKQNRETCWIQTEMILK